MSTAATPMWKPPRRRAFCPEGITEGAEVLVAHNGRRAQVWGKGKSWTGRHNGWHVVYADGSWEFIRSGDLGPAGEPALTVVDQCVQMELDLDGAA